MSPLGGKAPARAPGGAGVGGPGPPLGRSSPTFSLVCLAAGRWLDLAGGWWLVAGGWWLVALRLWLAVYIYSDLLGCGLPASWRGPWCEGAGVAGAELCPPSGAAARCAVCGACACAACVELWCSGIYVTSTAGGCEGRIACRGAGWVRWCMAAGECAFSGGPMAKGGQAPARAPGGAGVGGQSPPLGHASPTSCIYSSSTGAVG